MFDKIQDLYCDVSNLLIQKIDASDYDGDIPIDVFLNATDPELYALYCVLEKIVNKEDK